VPASRSPSNTPLNWGILAPGRIARKFAEDLRLVPGARLAAVGSRSAATAAAFATTYADQTCRAYGSYQELVADPAVDVVYVASPHALHLEHARLALDADKPVLCEKPLTMNAAEAEALVQLARSRDLFLMEAMWMACHPVILALREALKSGKFGEPRQLHADLGGVDEVAANDRLVDPALGAGALLDRGIYPLTFAHLMLGSAHSVTAAAVLSARGYDADIAIAGRYERGAVAAMTASTTSHSPGTATIATTQGLIELPAGFHHPGFAIFRPERGDPIKVNGAEPIIGSGLGNEAVEVARCLAAGRIESSLVPHEQTLELMRTMDLLRHQLGISYPADLNQLGHQP
jgi:predicted dehydrogenase